ncbi:hypothetical protein HMI56_002481 [Coelomomyces lativittatus]|nr:hypothetical protein HMI56_002481 [Coelomomyces lativittatus]
MNLITPASQEIPIPALKLDDSQSQFSNEIDLTSLISSSNVIAENNTPPETLLFSIPENVTLDQFKSKCNFENVKGYIIEDTIKTDTEIISESFDHAKKKSKYRVLTTLILHFIFSLRLAHSLFQKTFVS